MERTGEEQEDDQDAVVEREDAECAASVEGFEVVGDVERVDQDAGDEEAGENEEEVDADVAGRADAGEEVEDARAGVGVCPEKMDEKNHEDCEPSDSVERRNVSEAAWILWVACWRG